MFTGFCYACRALVTGFPDAESAGTLNSSLGLGVCGRNHADTDGVDARRWPLLPIAVWLAAVGLAWSLRPHLEARETSRHHELKRRQLEQKRASVAHKQAEQARRKAEFGELGVELLDRAAAAAQRIMTTAAARNGWTGDRDVCD